VARGDSKGPGRPCPRFLSQLRGFTGTEYVFSVGLPL